MIRKMNSYTALRPLCSWRIALGAFQYVFDVCKCAASWFGFHHFLYGRIRVSIVVGILVRILAEDLERILVDTALPSPNSPQPELHLGALSCLILQLQYYYFYYFVLSKASATNCPSVRLSSDKYTSCHACMFSAKSIVRSCHILKLSVGTENAE